MITFSQDRVSQLADRARTRLESARMDPILICNWERALFVHFHVEPAVLQREVPFPLELFDGRAFLTTVMLHVRRLRPFRCRRSGELLFKPLAIGELFNVRTYVRWRGMVGIHLLTQWHGSRINLVLGPRTYGLPYRLGRLNYEHNHESGVLSGTIIDHESGQTLNYSASVGSQVQLPLQGSLEEFLLEQYTAFTERAAKRRVYHIWHEPWPQTTAHVEFSDSELLTERWPFLRNTHPLVAHYSTGVTDVWLGRPYRV